ncbi:MAG: lysyl oxidase family protein [Anaerolineales bacterium]
MGEDIQLSPERWFLVVGAMTLLSLGADVFRDESAAPGIQPTVTPTASAQSVEFTDEIEVALPDLVTMPLTELRLVQDDAGHWRVVRFANAIANIGAGPLEVTGEPGADLLRYQVRQRIYSTSGEVALEPLLSSIEYHPNHGHWHLQDFARYELWSTNSDRTLRDVVDVSGKVSYCLMDTDKGEQGPDNPREYLACGPTLKGISAGWIDTYGAYLPGQFLTLTGLPNGVYAIRSVVNPEGHIRELDQSNNAVVVFFRLTDSSVILLEGPEDPLSRLRPAAPEN